MSLIDLKGKLARAKLLGEVDTAVFSTAQFGPKTPVRKLVDFVEYALDAVLDAARDAVTDGTVKVIELGDLLGDEFKGDKVTFTTGLYRKRKDVLGATLGSSMTIFQCNGMSYDALMMTKHLINGLAHEFYHLLQEKYGIQASLHAGAKYVNPRGKNRTDYLTNAEEVQARILPYVAQYIRDKTQKMDDRRDFIDDIWKLIQRDDPEFFHTVLATPLEAEIERVIGEAYEHAVEELKDGEFGSVESAFVEYRDNPQVDWSHWLHIAHVDGNTRKIVCPNGVSFALQADHDGVYLCNLQSNDKGKGHAREVLEQLTATADRVGIAIALDAIAGAGGMRQSALEAFYRRVGFKNVGGSNRMIYKPKPQAEAAAVDPKSIKLVSHGKPESGRNMMDGKYKLYLFNVMLDGDEIAQLSAKFIGGDPEWAKVNIFGNSKGKLGVTGMRQVIKLLRKRFPKLKTVAGERISGARVKSGSGARNASADIAAVERVLYRGVNPGDENKPLRISSHGRFGPGVYLTAVQGVANLYGETTMRLTVSGNLFNAMPGWSSLDPKAEAKIIRQLSKADAEKLALSKGWYKKDAEAFWESLRRLSDGDVGASKAIQKAGFTGIEGLGDGHEIVMFDPKHVKVAKEESAAVRKLTAMRELAIMDAVERQVYADLTERLNRDTKANITALDLYEWMIWSNLPEKEFDYAPVKLALQYILGPTRYAKAEEGSITFLVLQWHYASEKQRQAWLTDDPYGSWSRARYAYEAAPMAAGDVRYITSDELRLMGKSEDAMATVSLTDWVFGANPLSRLKARMEHARTGEWWEKLSPEEQQQYLKDHPGSKMEPTSPGDTAPDAPPAGGGKSWLRKGMTMAGEDRASLPSHIKALRIPPGWKSLQYNEDPNADLLAIGKDAKNRDQYVYSEKFVAANQASKFARIREIDKKFDTMLAQTRTDQEGGGTKGEHALVAELVFATGIRPGSDEDTGADKKAYGATTLKGEHVKVDDNGNVRLQFTGKKGVDLDLPVPDAALAKKLAERKAAAGDDGNLFPKVDDASLRDYVKTLDGGDFKTKDIRTALGTRLARNAMQKLKRPSNAKDYKAAAKEVGKVVSQVLGNTPAVALTSYIDPTLFTEWRAAAGV